MDAKGKMFQVQHMHDVVQGRGNLLIFIIMEKTEQQSSTTKVDPSETTPRDIGKWGLAC